MTDTISLNSSISLDAVRAFSGTQPRLTPVRHAYSVGHDIIVETVPGQETDVARSFNRDLEGAARQLARLLALPPDWDSYGANPIDRQKAAAALYLIWISLASGAPAPAIVPTSDGGIQLEWHRRGVDLEIRVISRASFEMYFEDLATGMTCEGEIETDLAPLRSFLERVTD